MEEARSEEAAAAVLECPDLLAIDVDLCNEQVCGCTSGWGTDPQQLLWARPALVLVRHCR
jgi:hypothetical protein